MSQTPPEQSISPQNNETNDVQVYSKYTIPSCIIIGCIGVSISILMMTNYKPNQIKMNFDDDIYISFFNELIKYKNIDYNLLLQLSNELDMIRNDLKYMKRDIDQTVTNTNSINKTEIYNFIDNYIDHPTKNEVLINAFEILTEQINETYLEQKAVESTFKQLYVKLDNQFSNNDIDIDDINKILFSYYDYITDVLAKLDTILTKINYLRKKCLIYYNKAIPINAKYNEEPFKVSDYLDMEYIGSILLNPFKPMESLVFINQKVFDASKYKMHSSNFNKIVNTNGSLIFLYQQLLDTIQNISMITKNMFNNKILINTDLNDKLTQNGLNISKN